MPRAVTAERIQVLLFRQYFVGAADWNNACKELIDDCRFVRRNAIDCSVWHWTHRPVWPKDECAWGTKKVDTYPTPLWGWLAVAHWSGASDENVAGLFYVLMKSCCGSVGVLNSRHNGRDLMGLTPFMIVALSMCTRAWDLLVEQRGIRVGLLRDAPGYPHSALQVLIDKKNHKLAQLVLSRLSDQKREEMAVDRCKFIYACDVCPPIAWALFTDLLKKLADPAAVSLFARSYLPIETKPGDMYLVSALASLASATDRKFFDIFIRQIPSLISLMPPDDAATISAVAKRLWFRAVGHDEMSSRAFLSPLCSALVGTADVKDRDARGAWLVARLPSVHLNRYHPTGWTAAMYAAHFGMHLTISALLKRGEEVDLLAEQIHVAEGNAFVPVDALALSTTRFHGKCAVDFLPNPLPPELEAVAKELRDQTEWQQNTLPSLLSGQALPMLMKTAHFPPELVLIVCKYGGF